MIRRHSFCGAACLCTVRQVPARHRQTSLLPRPGTPRGRFGQQDQQEELEREWKGYKNLPVKHEEEKEKEMRSREALTHKESAVGLYPSADFFFQ